MTHPFPAGLQATLASAAMRMAHLVKLTLANGSVIAMTDWDQAITANIDGLGNVAYSPADIQSVAAFSAQLSAPVDDSELVVTLDEDSFKADEVRSGLFSGATVKVGLTDPDVPGDAGLHRVYDVGQARLDGLSIRFELLGPEKRLEQSVGRLLTVNCPWAYGGPQCGINTDIAAWTALTAAAVGKEVKPIAGGLVWFRCTTAGTTGASEPAWPGSGTVVDGTVTWTAFKARRAVGTVTGVTDKRVFAASGLNVATDHFGDGLLVWLTGGNAGQARPIRSDSGSGALVLHIPAFSTITVGDTFTAIAGCRKRRVEDCIGKHANAQASSSLTLRFGGFDFLAPEDVTLSADK